MRKMKMFSLLFTVCLIMILSTTSVFADDFTFDEFKNNEEGAGFKLSYTYNGTDYTKIVTGLSTNDNYVLFRNGNALLVQLNDSNSLGFVDSENDKFYRTSSTDYTKK